MRPAQVNGCPPYIGISEAGAMSVFAQSHLYNSITVKKKHLKYSSAFGGRPAAIIIEDN